MMTLGSSAVLASPPTSTLLTSTIPTTLFTGLAPIATHTSYPDIRLQPLSSHQDIPLLADPASTWSASHMKPTPFVDVLSEDADSLRSGHCRFPFLTCSSHGLESEVAIYAEDLEDDHTPQRPFIPTTADYGDDLREMLFKDTEGFDISPSYDGSMDNLTFRTIPQYVFDYAPFVYLYSEEEFWPGDIAEHLEHTTPYLEYTPLNFNGIRRNLSDLDDMNVYGRRVFLTSDDNVEDRPDWLGGRKNIPEDLRDHDSSCDDGTLHSCKPSNYVQPGSGRSRAPAVLILVPKPDGVVDAFWWYFYSYNLGNKVFGIRFGNHVGDWEHSIVRFRHGVPETIFMSQHDGGDAYNFSAVEKIGKRPVVYSARGSHANYATPGIHRYILPWGLLHDVTDPGPLWDPALNAYSYTYNMRSDTLYSANETRKTPTDWFFYSGRWGDKYYPMSDTRQYQFAGQYHYVSGPWGPRYHNLGRQEVCQGRGMCKIKDSLPTVDVRLRVYMYEGDILLAPLVMVLALTVLVMLLGIIRCLERGKTKERAIYI